MMLGVLTISAPGTAQIHQPPVTDSAAQASPIIPSAANSGHTVDGAINASPIGPTPGGEFIPGDAELRVHLTRAVDSGSARNGEMLQGILDAPIRTSAGRTLNAGTPVEVTVVVALPAGKLQSAGEITLQVIQVGGVGVFSDQVTHHGEIGPRDLPDSNPAKGTEASIAAGAPLTFKVSPLPSI